MEIQNHLTSMKVPFNGSNITLEDICYKPANDNCTVMSVLQFFQNSPEKLNMTALTIHDEKITYLDHIYSCNR